MAKVQHILQRTCVGCFKKNDQSKLLAITRVKPDQVLLNVHHKIPGRSAYLCQNKPCLKRATQRKGKNAFEQNLKVPIPLSVLQELEKHMDNLVFSHN